MAGRGPERDHPHAVTTIGHGMPLLQDLLHNLVNVAPLTATEARESSLQHCWFSCCLIQFGLSFLDFANQHLGAVGRTTKIRIGSVSVTSYLGLRDEPASSGEVEGKDVQISRGSKATVSSGLHNRVFGYREVTIYP